MAKLTGYEALQYMQQNPGQYKLLKGDPMIEQQLMQMAPPQKQDSGGILGFLKKAGQAVADPFIDLGRNTINTAALAGEIAKTGGDKKAFRDLAMNVETGNYDPTVGSKQDFYDLYDNPELRTTQNVASLLSFAAPGGAAGKGFKGAVQSGALSGALSGFGASKDTEFGGLLKDTLVGTGTGAATAGALYGAGRGIKALKNAGVKRRNKGLQGFYQGETIPAEADPVKRLQDLGILDSQYKVKNPLVNKSTGKASKEVYNQASEKVMELMQKDPQRGTEAARALKSILPDNSYGTEIDSVLTTLGVDDAGNFAQAPGSLTSLQKGAKTAPQKLAEKARMGEYRTLGIRPSTVKKAGTLNTIDKFNDVPEIMDDALKMTGLTDASGRPMRTPEAIMDLPQRLGEIRYKEISQLNTTAKIDDFVDKLATKLSRQSKDVSQDEARMIISDLVGEQVGDPNKLMSGTIDATDLFNITQNYGPIAREVKTSTTTVNPDAKAKELINDYANNLIKVNSPQYSKANRAFAVLYDQVDNIAKQMDRKTTVNPFMGRNPIYQNIIPFAERKGYQIAERAAQRAGNMQGPRLPFPQFSMPSMPMPAGSGSYMQNTVLPAFTARQMTGGQPQQQMTIPEQQLNNLYFN